MIFVTHEIDFARSVADTIVYVGKGERARITMNNHNLSDELINFALELADASRAILLDAAANMPTVEVKPDRSLVTQTDKQVEQTLRDLIMARYPEHGIAGEELGTLNLDAEYVWVLDPIDGTAPFIAGLPVYGTLIGLALNKRPYIGVIDHPATDDRWWGIAGERAVRNGSPVKTRRCEQLSLAFMTNSSPDLMTSAERQVLDKLRPQVRYVQYGGSCFSYALLASGRVDLSIDSGLDAFDVFAPAAVIEGASGVISDWQGNEITLDWAGQVIAAGDPQLHQTVLAQIAASQEA